MAERVKKEVQAGIIEAQAFGRERNPFDLRNNHYDFDESFHPWEPGDDPRSIHTVPDLIRCLAHKETKNVDIEAKVFFAQDGEARLVKLNRDKFVETARNNRRRTFREGIDTFLFDNTGSSEIVGGHDFVPLLGGPFTKQLYYTDYLKQHQAAFFAYHHDPVARRSVNMMKHFTLGRGFRVDCEDKKALALWEAFAEVNDFYSMFDPLALELSIYGEIMMHWLPNHASTIRWRTPESEIPRAFIPRVRLTDPSTIWEIITYPEDMSSKGILAYQQIFPTQWQMFTAKDPLTGDRVPGTKFIYQQIPGADMMHFKINTVSNEKRGRSDLFPVLSYLKRLRDAVNYSLVSEMKNAAWCIDTSVDGSPDDVQKYIKSQRELGTVPSAGSEFVHTKKITREYRANQGAGGKDTAVFDWCMSMISMGFGIPLSYYGGLHAQGTSRANAVVGTEPVAKMFEDRQTQYQKIIKNVSKRFFDWAGVKADLEITFPEIITQDRSQKMKDLALAVSEGWINRKRAAEIAAKELGITDFDFDTEEAVPEVNSEPQDTPAPLSSNAAIPGTERSQIKRDNS